MSTDTKNKIREATGVLHQLSSLVLVILTSLITYLVKDIYDDFKEVKRQMNTLTTASAVQEERIKQLEARVVNYK